MHYSGRIYIHPYDPQKSVSTEEFQRVSNLLTPGFAERGFM